MPVVGNTVNIAAVPLRKVGEGPVYVVARRKAAQYNLLVKKQCNKTVLADDLHPHWELC